MPFPNKKGQKKKKKPKSKSLHVPRQKMGHVGKKRHPLLYHGPNYCFWRSMLSADASLKRISHLLQNIPMFRAARKVRTVWNKLLQLLMRKQTQGN